MEDELETLVRKTSIPLPEFHRHSLSSLNYRQLSWVETDTTLISPREKSLQDAALKAKLLRPTDKKAEIITSVENLQNIYRNTKPIKFDIRFNDKDPECIRDSFILQNRLFNNFGTYQVTFNDAKFSEIASEQFQKEIDLYNTKAEIKRLLNEQDRERPKYYLLQKLPIESRKIILKLYPNYKINRKNLKSNKICPKIKLENEFKKYHLFNLSTNDIIDDLYKNRPKSRSRKISKMFLKDKKEVDHAYDEIKLHINNEINKYLMPKVPLYHKNNTKYSQSNRLSPKESNVNSLHQTFNKTWSFKKLFKRTF